jgi:CHAT domain-containing protein
VTYFRAASGVGRLCITHDEVVHAIGGPLSVVAPDAKLIEFATIASYPPNAKLDAQFPVSAALHLREFLFGGLDACLRPGTQVTVALPNELAGVPLGALLQEAPPRAGDGYDLAKAHWLIRDFSFSLVVSARQFLAALPYLRRAPAPRTYLGIGDPKLDKPRVARLPATRAFRGALRTPNSLADLIELPETADELRAVGAVLAASAGDILVGQDATEAAFRAKPLREYDVIHFATHGLIREDFPGLTESALVLTPVGDRASDDGLLLASEIFQLSLNARLVVLSACNTAKYDITQASHAVQDLQTAFTVAGAPTLLASLWPIDSATARDLMVRFSQEWHVPRSNGAGDALARATRAYLDKADAPHQHPRFWAPFVVAGNGGVRSVPEVPIPVSASAQRQGQGVGRQ